MQSHGQKQELNFIVMLKNTFYEDRYGAMYGTVYMISSLCCAAILQVLYYLMLPSYWWLLDKHYSKSHAETNKKT